jgi:hypothetical protein
MDADPEATERLLADILAEGGGRAKTASDRVKPLPPVDEFVADAGAIRALLVATEQSEAIRQDYDAETQDALETLLETRYEALLEAIKPIRGKLNVLQMEALRTTFWTWPGTLYDKTQAFFNWLKAWQVRTSADWTTSDFVLYIHIQRTVCEIAGSAYPTPEEITAREERRRVMEAFECGEEWDGEDA